MPPITHTPTKIKYTAAFLLWLKSEPLVNQEIFTIQVLFEVYINSMCWNEIPRDPELQDQDYVIRQ